MQKKNNRYFILEEKEETECVTINDGEEKKNIQTKKMLPFHLKR